MATPDVSPAPSKGQAFLYVIGPDSGPYKVGFSAKPKSRLQFLNSGSPVRLSLHYTLAVPSRDQLLVEKYAHALLWSRRSSGEWFDVTVEQAEMAIRLAADGIAAGRLPPGPSAREARPSESPKKKDREPGLRRRNRVAADTYYELALPSRRQTATYDPEQEIDRRDQFRRLNERVSQICGPVAVTLLSMVVAQGRPISSLPGSHRQSALFLRKLDEALDCVAVLTGA